VSSFGNVGTNAHVVLEEAPPAGPARPSRPHQLLLLSAKSGSALETASANLGTYLAAHPDLDLADAAYTLQVGRRPFNHGRLVVCRDLGDGAAMLQGGEPGRVLTQSADTETPPIVF